MSRPYPYALIATDLDGTLLRSDLTVSQRTRAALAAATAAGAAHIIVTGRPVSHTAHIFKALDYQGLAVCAQGAQVYHAGEKALLTSVTFDRELAALALAKLEAEVGPLTLAANSAGLDGAFLVSPGYQYADEIPAVAVRDPDQLWDAPISKVFIQHPALGDDELTETARAIVGDLVNVVMAGAGLVELLPLGLSKATGLRIAARRLGVTAARTIAFGDMPNDVPMLQWAGYGVAMADAHQELKAVADEVTADNDEDGIAVVLERLARP